jgi:PAS domain S-box-containing protein
MNPDEPPARVGDDGEIPGLIATLIATERRLVELTAGEVDAVAAGDGRTFLLQRAQEQLRHTETAKQAAILNALPSHIALLDIQGLILSANEAWRHFAGAKVVQSPGYAMGVNYLDICENAQGAGSSEARQIAEGIRSVLGGSKDFSFEYHYHTPTERRWFRLVVTPLSADRLAGAVVMHVNISERKLAEEALWESEARFRGTFEQAAVGIAHVSTDGRFLRVNDKLCEILGYGREELLGLSFAGLTVPEDQAGSHEAHHAMLTGKLKTHNAEKRYRRKQGEVVWVNLAATLERTAAGEPKYFISVLEDITGRKRTDEVVRQLAAIVEHSADAIIGKTLDGIITSWNPAAEKMFGHSAAEIIGRPLEIIVPPDRLHEEVEILAGLARGDMIRHLETVRIRKDSQRFDVSVTISPIKDSTGSIVGASKIVRDISERKRTETALEALSRKTERRERMLTTMLSSLTDFAYSYDREGRFLFANQPLLNLWGRTLEEVVGRNFLELGYPEKMAEKLQREVRQVFETKQSLTGETPYTNPAGLEGHYEYIFSPAFAADGTVDFVVGSTRDITERKRTEQALRESEEHFHFLNDLGEATRTLADPEQIMAVMSRMLGEQLGASRCAYADVEKDGEQFTILHDYTDGCASSTGHYQLSRFGPKVVAAFQNGQTMIVRDVDKELLPNEGADMFNAIGIKAIITCPLVKAGVLRAIMAVHQTTPRDWTPAEIAIVQEVVERCWATKRGPARPARPPAGGRGKTSAPGEPARAQWRRSCTNAPPRPAGRRSRGHAGVRPR